jgi:hypothetical protein
MRESIGIRHATWGSRQQLNFSILTPMSSSSTSSSTQMTASEHEVFVLPYIPLVDFSVSDSSSGEEESVAESTDSFDHEVSGACVEAMD